MRINLSLYLVITFCILVTDGKIGEASAQGCLVGGCHSRLTAIRYMHGPVAAEMAGVNGCTMCHIPNGPSCTNRKGGVFVVKRKGLCVTCHDKGTGSQHSDKEIEPKCLNCHNPHGSEASPYMLRASRK